MCLLVELELKRIKKTFSDFYAVSSPFHGVGIVTVADPSVIGYDRQNM